MSTAETTDMELIQRLTRDLKKASRTLGKRNARYLVDLYYQMQEFRIRAGGQTRAAEDTPEPHALVSWYHDQFRNIENDLKKCLGEFAQEYTVGRWLQCSPEGSLVLKTGNEYVPIETLKDGDQVVSYDRHHSAVTGYRESYGHRIRVGSRRYVGDLVQVSLADKTTLCTINHKWPVFWMANQEKYIVYLMQQGGRFRVGWCRLFNKRSGTKNGRFNFANRARNEKADAAWILKVFDSNSEASMYESYVNTTYGISTLPFMPVSGADIYTGEFLDTFFSMLDSKNQAKRASECLADHGLHPGLPLFVRVGQGSNNKGCFGTVYAANLIPGLMAIPVLKAGKAAPYQELGEVSRVPYAGNVYSLDVSDHHTFIQDGVVTHNSICGIGPVISAGLLAHLDITKARTAGHFWSFAGLTSSVKWPSREEAKRTINEIVSSLPTELDPMGLVALYYRYSRQADRFADADDIRTAEALATKFGGPVLRNVIPTMARCHNRDGKIVRFSEVESEFETHLAFYAQLMTEKSIEYPEARGPLSMAVAREAAERFGRNVFNVLSIANRASKGGKLTVDVLASALARRPFNQQLKTLTAFKVGESFVKVQNREADFYGGLYAMRKQQEQEANARGEYAEIARVKLATTKIGKDTDAYKSYIEGRLPPAHVHSRARRWAVKIFLSHLHHVMYVDWYGTPPPAPYILSHPEMGDHRHYIEVPNFPIDNPGKKLADMGT